MSDLVGNPEDCFSRVVSHFAMFDNSITTINFFFQNAGAIIGKGGTNIKRLRADVSIDILS